MLTVLRLKEYTAELQAAIPEINSAFLVVTRDEVSKFMKEHTDDKNILLLAILPEHDVTGKEDSSKVNNMMGFYLFEKTDYSEHDHDSYLSVFARTQAAAKKVVDQLLQDKANSTGALCGFLNYLDESSISITPIKGISGCNGYFVGLSFETNM
jgi:hypothetical protein